MGAPILERNLISMHEYSGTGWANMEFRPYAFDPKSGSSASLIETKESRKRRTGDEKALTKAEQLNLRVSATDSWEKQGLIRSSEKYK
jgi:hypothetical protein